MSGSISTPDGSLGDAIASLIDRLNGILIKVTGSPFGNPSSDNAGNVITRFLNHVRVSASLTVSISCGFSLKNVFNGGGLTSLATDFFFRVNKVEATLVAAVENIDLDLNFGLAQVDIRGAGIEVQLKLALSQWNITIGDIINKKIDTDVRNKLSYDGSMKAVLPVFVNLADNNPLKSIVGDVGFVVSVTDNALFDGIDPKWGLDIGILSLNIHSRSD
jgi:hypothetical protein